MWSKELAALILGHFLAREEALQDGQAREVEDGDEEAGDEPCNEQDYEGRHEWLLDCGAFRGHEHVRLSQQHGDVHTSTDDDTLANSGHDPSDNVHGSVGARIANDHEE